MDMKGTGLTLPLILVPGALERSACMTDPLTRSPLSFLLSIKYMDGGLLFNPFPPLTLTLFSITSRTNGLF